MSSSEVERWTSRPMDLEFCAAIDETFFEDGCQVFESFISLSEERLSLVHERVEWKKRYLNWVSDSLWETGRRSSQLDLISLVGRYFCDLDSDSQERFFCFPLEIQKRNLLRASISTLLALILGYEDYRFLKDYYTVILFMDYPFSEKMWSESEKHELNKLISDPSQEKSNSSIKALYEQAISSGVSLVKSKIENKGLAQYLRWSFENLNWDGLLINLNNKEMNDLDAVTIISHRAFAFDELDLSEPVDLSLILKSMRGSNEEYHRVNLAISKLLREPGQQVSGYIEIVGL